VRKEKKTKKMQKKIKKKCCSRKMRALKRNKSREGEPGEGGGEKKVHDVD
jgi:hypothetical protein